ncbi:hypothetical protein C8J56DRAFT_925452 [Mycena floridula]|nr:hypothetical protein C8J56DRAFT_925452 [Mycena floridula]
MQFKIYAPLLALLLANAVVAAPIFDQEDVALESRAPKSSAPKRTSNTPQDQAAYEKCYDDCTRTTLNSLAPTGTHLSPLDTCRKRCQDELHAKFTPAIADKMIHAKLGGYILP